MKQIDNMQKKAYMAPAIMVIDIDQSDIICSSPHGFSGPLGARERYWDDDELDEY